MQDEHFLTLLECFPLRILVGIAVGTLSEDWLSLDFVRTVTCFGFKLRSLLISIKA